MPETRSCDVSEQLRALQLVSTSLARFVDQDDRALQLLEGGLPDRDECVSSIREALGRDGLRGLRIEKRRRLAQIAAHDAAGKASLDTVGLALSRLADACLVVAMEATEAPRDLAVVGLGKLGGRELNYISDIDLMFVCTSRVEEAGKAVQRVLRDLGSFSPQGRAYVIDTSLRPEGRAGPMVRSLDGYLHHYERWSKPWEHQALIKARFAAGCEEVGSAFVQQTRALVYPQEVTGDRVASIRRIKERVEAHVARIAPKDGGARPDDVKLGPGGIRDIEFSVQLLQMVHGGTDTTVREASTLEALRSLVDGGYIADEDGAGLEVAYRWLRAVEHRLQLWQERRVHVLPAEPEERARLAHAMHFGSSPAADARARFESAHAAVLSDVRARFEKLFYRPLIEALAETPGIRLSAEALRERLRYLGFRDVDRAARTLEGLVAGTSRRAKLFRLLTPALLRFMSSSPLPDEGLLSFLRLGETLGERIDALGAMRDNPPGLAFLAQVLGSGRVMGDMLAHAPEELNAIAEPQRLPGLKSRERLVREAHASLRWREPEDRWDGLRRFKRREMLRVTLADLSGKTDAAGVGLALANLADACLDASLAPGVELAVIGMGKLGGRELSYASDVDIMLVHSGDQEPARAAAEEILGAIGEVGAEGQAFRVDLGLRPEGKAGPLLRSLESYIDYYERWSKPWERMALIKARFVAGKESLSAELIAATRRFAFPRDVEAASLAQIRHLKARMQSERVRHRSELRRHVKLGPGAMSDIEFAVQLLQLQHGWYVEGLRTNATLEAIAAAAGEGLLSADQAARMTEAYGFLGRLRNRLWMLTGRPIDVLPAKPELLEALGVALGFAEQPRQELEEHYLRLTRRAERITDPLLYG